MKLIDTHCHLNFDAFDADRADVLQRAKSAGVEKIIIPSVDLVTARQALDLSEQHSEIHAAVGFHPNDTNALHESDFEEAEQLTQSSKVVAVGEIGLDYYWDKSPRDRQWSVFERQLSLAAKLALPVIIHNREAAADVLDILARWAGTLDGRLKTAPGVLHSFSGNLSDAERAVSLGFYLGFTGPVTYRKAEETRRIAAAIPLDRLLIETDAPFLTPMPYRGRRNEPAYVRLVADQIAVVRGLEPEEIAVATSINAETLFRFHSR
ncbi:TatD family hydrolase [Kamptonema cortianum]|nr:TatD family hydrolase [Kamptonema cortianum]